MNDWNWKSKYKIPKLMQLKMNSNLNQHFSISNECNNFNFSEWKKKFEINLMWNLQVSLTILMEAEPYVDTDLNTNFASY